MKTIIILFLSIFAFSGCQKLSLEKAPNATETASANEIKQISVEQAKDVVSSADVQFIDVRTIEEYTGGYAAKAVNFPLDKLESEKARLDKNKPVYVICQTGRRSQKGAEILRNAGFKEVYNIEGGTSAWSKAGFDLEKPQ